MFKIHKLITINIINMYNIDNDFIFHWNNKNILPITVSIIEKSINNNNIIANHKIENKNDVNKIISLIADDITICQSLHSICNFMQYINVNTKNSIKAEILISNHEKTLNLRNDIYNKLQEIKSFKKVKLTHEDEQFIDELIKCYKASGIELTKKNKELLQKINTEISNTEMIIEKHIHESENNMLNIEYDNLNGMPLHIINTFENIDCDNVKFKLDKLNYNLCLTYIQNNKVRNNIEYLYSKDKYEPIIGQIGKLFVLRDKRAKLLSFTNHSDYILSQQMCKNSEQVQTFLKKILDKLKLFDKKNNNTKNILDISFHLNKWKKDNGLDNDIIKEYFEIKDVISKIIKIYELIFDVKFIKLNNASVWCNDLLVYCIMSNDTNIGYLYLDLFNREGKYKQIRCFCLQSGCMYPILSDKYLKPIISLCASFGKFTNGITLINFGEVASIFHEFGYVMHHIFGKTKYIIFSGINVEEDFMETPAQILELLCYEPFVIKYLSNHYCKKTMMSDILIEKIIQYKNLEDNLNYKKNILLSYYDQIIYSSSSFINLCETSINENKKKQIQPALKILYDKLYNEILNKKSTLPLPKEFMEIIIGSDSKYYNYLWSKMLATDLFNSNIKGKQIDSLIGLKMKNCIFKHGGTKTSYEMCALYLGKEISMETDSENKMSPAQNDFERYSPTKYINNRDNGISDYCENFIDSVSNNFCEIIDD